MSTMINDIFAIIRERTTLADAKDAGEACLLLLAALRQLDDARRRRSSAPTRRIPLAYMQLVTKNNTIATSRAAWWIFNSQ